MDFHDTSWPAAVAYQTNAQSKGGIVAQEFAANCPYISVSGHSGSEIFCRLRLC